MRLLCARPHGKEVDFENGTFVVSKSCGLDTGSAHLEYGDEVPSGMLDARTLRQLYEPPLSRIELVGFVFSENGDPELRAAVIRRCPNTVEEKPVAAVPNRAPLPPPIQVAHKGKRR